MLEYTDTCKFEIETKFLESTLTAELSSPGPIRSVVAQTSARLKGTPVHSRQTSTLSTTTSRTWQLYPPACHCTVRQSLLRNVMNVRDPFNLHRSPAFNIIRGTARQAAANVKQRVVEAGAQAYENSKQAVEEMSTFSMPRNVPSFTNPQRELENRAWGSSGVTARSANANGGVMNGIQDRMGNFFEKNNDLPMYKDKPYSYASSRRQRPVWKRKRVLGVVISFVMIALYLLGPGGGDATTTEKAKDTWTWLQRPDTSSKVDWLDRREHVKEAFILSWDAYDRYAWGTSKMAHIQAFNDTYVYNC